MKKIVFVSLALIALVVVSCNKDQKAVKELEGTWEISKQDGQTVADSNKFTIKFEACKLKKDEWCSYTQTSNDGYSYSSDYKVIDDGTTLVQSVTDSTKGNIELSSTIDELTDSKLKLTLNFGGFLTTSEFDKK
mgnify:CR=1 FL=1